MSGSTTPSVVPTNNSDANGAAQLFSDIVNYNVFNGSGETTSTGPVVIGTTGGSVTVSGASIINDASAGGNSITTTTPTAVLASANDTISAASSATTVFGSSSGQTTFSLGGNDNSVTGGSGSIVGTVSGGNSTLVGGTGVSLFTVTGSNNLAVAGPSGTTGVNLSHSTGPETLATNPLGNSGTLVGILGSGADTVVGGSGHSTITAGSGQDAFIFVNGHAGGSETIIGFNSKDNLGFAGYGYSGSNVPTESVTLAGDQMKLNDGTTVLFAGLYHKIF